MHGERETTSSGTAAQCLNRIHGPPTPCTKRSFTPKKPFSPASFSCSRLSSPSRRLLRSCRHFPRNSKVLQETPTHPSKATHSTCRHSKTEKGDRLKMTPPNISLKAVPRRLTQLFCSRFFRTETAVNQDLSGQRTSRWKSHGAVFPQAQAT